MSFSPMPKTPPKPLQSRLGPDCGLSPDSRAGAHSTGHMMNYARLFLFLLDVAWHKVDTQYFVLYALPASGRCSIRISRHGPPCPWPQLLTAGELGLHDYSQVELIPFAAEQCGVCLQE